MTMTASATVGEPRSLGINDCLILVVDDTEFNRTLITAMLRQDGFRRIEHAVDGAEALRKISEEKPDLVILDIVMPGLDGFEVCRRLRADERFADLPVLVQTALSNTEDRNRAFALGTTDLITKPIDRNELLARVRIHLENRVLIQNLQLYRTRLENELFMAREMYNHLLPTPAAQEAIALSSGVKVRNHTVLSSELGGDMWGMLPLPGRRFGIYLLDVTGHGVTAALNAFRMHTVVQEIAGLAENPARFVGDLNQRAIDLFESGERATVIHGVIDPQTDTFTYAAAAATRPVLALPGEPNVRMGNAGGEPVGAVAGATYAAHVLPFPPGGRLLLYSNAVLTGSDPQESESAFVAMVEPCLQIAPLDEACERITAALAETIGEVPEDDMTLVFLARDA